MRPCSISNTEYHDFIIRGVRQINKEVVVDLFFEELNRRIIFSDVEILCADSFTLDNVISYVSCHKIDSNNTLDLISDLENYCGQYALCEIFRSRKQDFMGYYYTMFVPSYGASIRVISKSVKEQ